jgi:group I intron endonuclease
MTGIYKITSPSGKVYIGQTIDIQRRFKTYKSLKCKEQPRLYKSFIKYGVQNHKFEIIGEFMKLELTKFERYFQQMFDSTGINGLNCNLVATNEFTGEHSEQTKIKMSNSAKGKKKSAEHIAKLPQNQKGYKAKPRSESFKLNQSLYNGKNKKVYQYEKDGNFIKEWINVSEAERHYSINNISAAALGKLKTSGGFKWSYHKF